MKFKVRPPFAVHHEKIVESEEAGRKIKQPVVESHFAGETIELPEKDARKHLHKLEPMDKEAQALLEDIYEQNKEVAASRGATSALPAELDALIAKAVNDALAKAGVKAAAGAK